MDFNTIFSVTCTQTFFSFQTLDKQSSSQHPIFKSSTNLCLILVKGIIYYTLCKEGLKKLKTKQNKYSLQK